MGAGFTSSHKSSASGGVIKAADQPMTFATFDPELEELQQNIVVWADALGRVCKTLVKEAHVRNREHTLVAIQENMRLIGTALDELIAAVWTRELEED